MELEDELVVGRDPEPGARRELGPPSPRRPAVEELPVELEDGLAARKALRPRRSAVARARVVPLVPVERHVVHHLRIARQRLDIERAEAE